MNCYAADRGLALETSTIKLKVYFPAVGPRIKQADYLTRTGIPTRNVWSFVPIAMQAGKSEVIDRGSPSVLPRDDVIYLKGQSIIRVRYAAILATTPGAFPKLMNLCLVH